MKQNNMGFKRIIPMLLAAFLLSNSSDAQDKNLTLAMLAKQQGNLADAKKYIEEAANHPETKNSAKMYNYRGIIYAEILRNPQDSTVYTPDAVYIATESFYKSYTIAKAEANNKYIKEAREYLIPDLSASFMGYILDQPYKKKEWDRALQGLDMMLDISRNIDKKKELQSNYKISDTMIYEYRIDAAYQSKKCDIVKQTFDSMVRLNYNQSFIYLMMEDCYTTIQGDTAKGLEVLAAAKERFPKEKGLTDRELQLYLAMGKEDALLDKLNTALSKTPDDFPALFVRGNIYDRKISDFEKKEDMYSDSVDVYKEKAKYAKTPQLKTSYNNRVMAFQKMRDSLQKLTDKYIDLAETDYKNALKSAKNDSARADANFNIGSLILHRTRPLVEKINNSNNDQNRKALETMLYEKYREAIGYINQFEKVYPKDEEALRIQKELYYKLSVYTKTAEDTAKYEEYKKKYSEARKQ